jgi:hypothetical protein
MFISKRKSQNEKNGEWIYEEAVQTDILLGLAVK